jgi:hypothetical protein
MVTRKDAQPRKIEVPADIWLIVASYLLRRDWKALRLVCEDLKNVMVHMPLITSLWFSPHQEDIEVFRKVCNDEFFAKHVTPIYYDTSRFPNLNMEEVSAQWPLYNEDEERALEFHKRIND